MKKLLFILITASFIVTGQINSSQPKDLTKEEATALKNGLTSLVNILSLYSKLDIETLRTKKSSDIACHLLTELGQGKNSIFRVITPLVPADQKPNLRRVTNIAGIVIPEIKEAIGCAPDEE